MAAVLASGRIDDSAGLRSALERWGAALSHRSAAELWRLLPANGGTVHVSVPYAGGPRRCAGICAHRSRSLSDAAVTARDGIPVTKPARTIADLRADIARRRPTAISARELRRAIRQAEILGLPTEHGELTERTRSDLELDFLTICRRHDLPEPEVNVRIDRHLVDFLWRERRLVVETDGYRYHRGRAAFEDDRGRDLALRSLGFEVLHLSERQVSDEPRRVADLLRRLLCEEARGT